MLFRSVRCRPLLRFELKEGIYEVVRAIDDKAIELVTPMDNGSTEDILKITRHKEKIYYFDYVFDQYTTQESLFNTAVKTLIDSIIDGYNTTCFCYGATGAGKSHTYFNIVE